MQHMPRTFKIANLITEELRKLSHEDSFAEKKLSRGIFANTIRSSVFFCAPPCAFEPLVLQSTLSILLL